MRSKQHIASCIFACADATRDFMDPDRNPLLPLFEPAEKLNRLLAKRVYICAKLLYLRPIMNSNSLPFAGLLKLLENATSVNDFRNQEGDAMAAFVCPDTPSQYLDKYSTILNSRALWRMS